MKRGGRSSLLMCKMSLVFSICTATMFYVLDFKQALILFEYIVDGPITFKRIYFHV